MPPHRRRVITTYIVTKPGTNTRITFSYLPNLTTDLPVDFAAPGETVIVSERIIAEEEKPISRAIRTVNGFSVVQDSKQFDITFPGESNE